MFEHLTAAVNAMTGPIPHTSVFEGSLLDLADRVHEIDSRINNLK